MNSSKAASRIILFATLATTLLGSLSPTLGFANMFENSIHDRCRNEASLLQFWITSSDSTISDRASSRSCSFGYSISLSQTSASLVQGMNISITVSVSLSRGVAGPVDLSVQELPNGLKVGLNPSRGHPPSD